MKLFRLFLNIFDVFTNAHAIKQNEDKRKKSVIFGIYSIVYSVLAFAFAFGGALLINIEANLLTIFIIIIAIAFLISAAVSLLGALLRVIAQFTINRNAMSWIALIIFIAATAGSVLIVLNYLG